MSKGKCIAAFPLEGIDICKDRMDSCMVMVVVPCYESRDGGGQSTLKHCHRKHFLNFNLHANHLDIIGKFRFLFKGLE